MQRKGVWTASKMHLLLIRNTAVESQGNAWPEKGDQSAAWGGGVCTPTDDRIWEVHKPLQSDTLLSFSQSGNLQGLYLPAPLSCFLSDCSWLLFSQDKNQEMQKLGFEKWKDGPPVRGRRVSQQVRRVVHRRRSHLWWLSLEKNL